MIWKRTFPNSPLIFLDTGNFTDNPTPEGNVKTEALILAMGTLGYRATGLGERDLSMGYEFLDGLAKKAKFPFVSANTLYQKSGKPVFAPYAVFTLTQKEFKDLPVKSVKVGVTSFVRFNPTFLKAAPNGDNIIVGNPMEEAKKVIPELRSKCDFLIVLAALPKDDVHMIAKTYPGINLIFAAYGGIMTPPEEAEGDTRIAYLGNQGKQIAEIREAKPARKWVGTTTFHYLSATYPEDPAMKQTVALVLEDINNRNRKIAEERGAKVNGLAAAESASSLQAQSTYLGSGACQSCHPAEYEIWSGTAHAHAFDILVQKQADFNPECVVCHVTGFNARGGFVDAKNTPQYRHVQCESCHGPGGAHPDNPSAPYGKAGGVASCAPCHKPANSPNFDFQTYWAKIRHQSVTGAR